MAYWPGAHGDQHSRGWYVPVSDPRVYYPPLPPRRPPPGEVKAVRDTSSYALATVPPGFRVDPHPTAVPTSPPRQVVRPLGAVSLPSTLLVDPPHSPPPTPPATPSPPVIEKKDVSFDDTILREFLEWAEGRRECLSPLASTDLGFDQWTYQLRNKTPPQPDQELALKQRLWYLANASPLKMWHAIQTCELRALLGPGFEWVQTPEKW